MKAGRLRERIIFQRQTSAADEFRQRLDVWSEIAPVWAAVEPIAGREYFAAQQVQAEVTTRITCRYSSALAQVTPKDRIKHGTVIYDIKSIIDVDNRHRELQFMCVQHGAT